MLGHVIFLSLIIFLMASSYTLSCLVSVYDAVNLDEVDSFSC